MNVAWFWALTGMFAAYAALDGYDLGVGALYCWIAPADRDRRLALASIAPVWNGNEVWLIAGGGMLVVSFPRVYASGFSGFYLALVLVLWLLIARGVSLEFRHQVDHGLWRTFWDVWLTVASLLLALLLGLALGNVIRGVPIGSDGLFQATFTLLLNPYALLTGLLSLAILFWYGANYLRVKTAGALQQRARYWSPRLGGVAATLMLASTVGTSMLRAGIMDNFWRWPALLVFPLAVLAGFVMSLLAPAARDRQAFRGSALAIVALLGTAAATIFPELLHSTISAADSLNIYNAAAGHHGLVTSFIANAVGMVAVALYTTYVHRTFGGKVRLDTQHY